MTRAFFDSNILVYSVAYGDPRQPVARELVERGGCISVQSLTEYVTVTRRKAGMSWERVILTCETIIALCDPPLPLTFNLHQLGLEVAQRHKLAVYDSMIVAAALTAGCDILYSEDMHDGLVIDGRLTIRNPFVQAAG